MIKVNWKAWFREKDIIIKVTAITHKFYNYQPAMDLIIWEIVTGAPSPD